MHFIGTMIGLFGILKYALDRVMIDNVRLFQEAVTAALKQSGKLSKDDQSKLALDIGTRMWSRLVDNPNTRNVTLFSQLSASVGSLYAFVVPEFARMILYIPTYIITYPLRLFVNSKKLEAVRMQTRAIAIEGLWSFIIPLAAAILLAAVLVQEVQYVRVVNGEGPTGPDISQYTIKRVVIGPGRFSISLPHHPIIYMVSYTLILFAIFHTISFFLLLSRYGEES